MGASVPKTVVRNSAKLIRRLILNAEIPWEKQRSRMNIAMASARPPKTVSVTSHEIAGVLVERVEPVAGKSKGTVVHIHGGGFTVGSPASCRMWAAAVSATLHLTVEVPDYSLAPEHPFPEGLDQVSAVLDQVINEHGAERVVVSGDSAGANLAISALQRRVLAQLAMPAGLIMLSPWLDISDDRLSDPGLVRRDPLLTPTWLEACANAYAPGRATDPEVSPLYGSMDGLPPILIQGGTDDILAPDANRFVAGMEPGHVSLSLANGLWHDFVLQVGMLAAADQAMEITTAFLAEQLALH